MRLVHVLAGLGVVATIASGQILFKLAALAYERRGTGLPTEALAYLGIGLVIYGIATIAWVWLLRFVPLNAAYPLMALAFVIVPCLSAVFLSEPLSVRVLLGALLIAAGVVVANI